MRSTLIALTKKYLVTAFVAVAACTTGARAQSGIDTALANKLQASIEAIRTATNVKGISAAAYIPGRGMWKGVTGISHAGVPVDTNMLFSIGSITKTFVAAEIFKLIEAGSLSLTDTVGALLPPITHVNGAITVKQLLGHKSGLADYLNPSWQAAMGADYNAMWYYPAATAAFIEPPLAAPGGAYRYINANYSLLGMIIEAKTGDSLHRVLRDDFITPLGLGNTHMEVLESYPNAIAHNWTGPLSDPLSAVDASSTPHTALWSSVVAAGGYFGDPADLVKWGYNLYGGHVISSASLAEMLTFTPVSSSYFNGYGLGAQRFVADGRTYVGHAGNYFGYAASMLYHPADSICVAVLINTDCIATFQARALMDSLLDNITLNIHDQVWASGVVLSPNPANTELHIAMPAGTAATVSITDISGRRVYNEAMSGTSSTINTAGYKAGVYFVRVVSEGRVVTRSLVVQH